jgi:hypothetical protein
MLFKGRIVFLKDQKEIVLESENCGTSINQKSSA